MINSIKIKSINTEKGTMVARFSWNSNVWKKLEIVSINLFGEYILQSPNKWEQDRTWRIHEVKLNEWIPVITEMKETSESNE